MNSKLINRANELRSHGFTTGEIADELNEMYIGETFTFDSVRNKLRRMKNKPTNSTLMATKVNIPDDYLDIDKLMETISKMQSKLPTITQDETDKAINILEGVPEYPEEKLNVPETYSRTQDGTVDSTFITDYTTEDLQNDSKLLETIGLDPNKYEIQNVKVGNWEQNSKLNGVKTLHSIKITAKRRTEISYEQVMETLTDKVEPFYVAKFDTVKGKPEAFHRNLVIPLADLHFGITI